MQQGVKRLRDITQLGDYKEVILTGEKYEDDLFPPKASSIFSKRQNKFDDEKKSQFEERIEWKRLHDLYPESDMDLIKDISVKDVKQGQLGDCYFISTLRGLVGSHPNEIKKIFVNKRINKSGIYVLRFLIKGHPEFITVDDYVPYCNYSKTLAFAQKVTKNIWPILVEKAWAKINGSYEDIERGSPTDGLNSLVPYSIQSFTKDDLEGNSELEENIHKASKLNYILAASSKVTKGESDRKLHVEDPLSGIISDHCYIISGSYKVRIGTTTEHILKISNPWATQTYKGTWSDQDSKWTEELKEMVDFSKKNDGEFYTSYSNFIQCFESVTICKCNPFLRVISRKMSHKQNSYILINLTLPTNTDLSINIHQYMKRLFKPEDYKPGNIRVLIAEKTEDPKSPFKYVIGDYKYDTDILSIDSPMILRKGTYYLYIQLDCEDQLDAQFSCNMIGSDMIVSKVPHSEFGFFLINTLKDYARTKVENSRISPKDAGFVTKFFYSYETAGYGLYLFTNNSQNDSTALEKVTFTKLEGLKLLETSIRQKGVHISPILDKDKIFSEKYLEVKPGRERFLLVKMIERQCQSEYNYFTHIRYCFNSLIKMCLKDGKKKAISNPSAPKDVMNYYYLFHDYGVIFIFENKSKTYTLDEYFTLKKLDNYRLTNQDLQLSKHKPFWKFTVKPKKRVVKHLQKINMGLKTSFQYNYNHKFIKAGDLESCVIERDSPEELSDLEVATIITQKGVKCAIKNPNSEEPMKIYYKYYFFGPFYGFLFKNEDPNYFFKADFKFQLQNLKLKDPSKGSKDTWTIKLGYMQSQVKKLLRIDPKAASKVAFTYTYTAK
ncbi:unnamed protein product [Moneuplotes crassus]|uniref:Calpain catalytic domain-containing protein n=1 Tax=Euplotes crassus TaxID=5936 RepID=A0AAD1Y5P2_EUPCR|nr:unnamed protein product [Moneuplotes crassus]